MLGGAQQGEQVEHVGWQLQAHRLHVDEQFCVEERGNPPGKAVAGGSLGERSDEIVDAGWLATGVLTYRLDKAQFMKAARLEPTRDLGTGKVHARQASQTLDRMCQWKFQPNS